MRPETCNDYTLPEKWAKRDWDRLVRERDMAIKRSEELARRNGLLKAQLGWAQEDREELVRSLQSKIAKQSRVIRRYEQKANHESKLGS